MRLVLWDIDGTLMNSRSAVREARNRAMSHVYQVEGRPRGFPTGGFGGGMTDPQLTLAILELHGWSEAAALEHIDAFRDAYVAALEAVRETLARDLEILPGVLDVIERLRVPGITQSLLTGNFEAAARLKITCAGLDRYLDLEVGAFGSDNRDRLCLVPVALEKARRLRDPALWIEDVVVIGDSPRDIACARAGGARAVAVASGGHPVAELAEHRPDALLESLLDTDAAVAAILGQSRPAPGRVERPEALGADYPAGRGGTTDGVATRAPTRAV